MVNNSFKWIQLLNNIVACRSCVVWNRMNWRICSSKGEKSLYRMSNKLYKIEECYPVEYNNVNEYVYAHKPLYFVNIIFIFI